MNTYEVRISDEDGRAVARGTLRSLYTATHEAQEA